MKYSIQIKPIQLLALLVFCGISSSINAQYWLRNSGSLHEYWYNNLDVANKKLHNKQHFVNEEVNDTSIGKLLKLDFEPNYVKNRKLPFYEYQGQFYLEKGEDYLLMLNPILSLSQGQENGKITNLNTRGIEFKGNLGGKYGLGFYSQITENQWTAPSFVDSFNRRNGVIPGQIWWKNFKNKGYDYIGARGYITFTPIKKYVTAQFGNDNNFIGYGERSLILSDFSAPYLFLKLNTKFGKHIEYQNIFSRFTDYSPLLGNSLFTPKYGSFHRISAKLGKSTFIGISENVLFQRKDSLRNGYDMAYLNPVIFLRAAEIDGGSNDNVMMALDFKQHIKDKVIVYGQFLLDEFKLKYIRQDSGWWANKYGYQLGAKYVANPNFAISAEYNRVRPYTYSHFNTGSSYAHFNQSLAHPLGANFEEWYTRIHWIPQFNFIPKKHLIIIDGTLSIANQGVDSSATGNNYGGNILRANTTRPNDFGNSVLQGKKVNALMAQLNLSYRIGYASFIDLRIQHRSGSDYIAPNTHISLGYRLNAEFRKLDWF